MPDVSKNDVIELARELVQRPTPNPPGNEGAVVSYLTDRLTDSHIDFHIETQEVKPDRPNLIARAGDPFKGRILLTGHMDVVPAKESEWSGDPFEVRIENGRIFGRGMSDMTGSLAAKIVAAEAYLSTDPHPGEVLLAFAVDEERGGSGTQALVADGIDADGAILGEPSDMGVAIAHKGALRYDLTVRGENAHSGRPDKGTNAISKLHRVIDRIDALDREMQEHQHDLLPPGATVTVTQIDGGIAPNVVPARASATIDWRFLPGMWTEPDPFDDFLKQHLQDLSLGGDPITVEINRWDFGRAVEVSPDERIVQVVKDAARAHGLSGEYTGIPGGTDARYLVHDAGIPTVMFGPGSLEEDAHTVHESVPVEDLTTTAHVYRDAIARFFEDE